MPESSRSEAPDRLDCDEPTKAAGLTVDDVGKVAQLALLDLGPEELETFTGQLAAVLEHARQVEALDLDGVEPTHHPYPLVNVMRSDRVELLDHAAEDVLAEAPEVEDRQFRVPPALGEEM